MDLINCWLFGKKHFFTSDLNTKFSIEEWITVIKEQSIGQFYYQVLSNFNFNLYPLHFSLSSFCFFPSVLFPFHLFFLYLSSALLAVHLLCANELLIHGPWKDSPPEINKTMINDVKHYSRWTSILQNFF